MTDFKFNQLRDYFLKTTTVPDITLKQLEPNELVGMAILSIFDKKGLTVKTPQYSYEKPDNIIDKSEIYGVTEKQYEKAVKDIQKVLQKETGKDFSSLKIPSYIEMMKMMEDDKIDFEELSAINSVDDAEEVAESKPTSNLRPATVYDSKTPAVADSVEKPVPIKVPEKQGEYVLTDDEMATFVSEADVNLMTSLYAKVKNGYNFKPSPELAQRVENIQRNIEEFKPDEDVVRNVQNQLDGEQYNAKGQLVARVNNISQVYEKYKYEGDSRDYSEMIQYKPNGYKTMYYKREALTDDKGRTTMKKVAYSLDENEKVYKVLLPPTFENEEINEFNDYNEYQRFMQYAQKSGYDEATLDEMLSR